MGREDVCICTHPKQTHEFKTCDLGMEHKFGCKQEGCNCKRFLGDWTHDNNNNDTIPQEQEIPPEDSEIEDESKGVIDDSQDVDEDEMEEEDK